jgi:hypothetical protein
MKRTSQWKTAKDGHVVNGTSIGKDNDSQNAIILDPEGAELKEL